MFHKQFVMEHSANKLPAGQGSKLKRHQGLCHAEDESKSGPVLIIKLLKGFKFVEDISPEPETFIHLHPEVVQKHLAYTEEDQLAFVRIQLWITLMATWGEQRFIISTSGKGDKEMAHHITCPQYNCKLTDGEYGKNWNFSCSELLLSYKQSRLSATPANLCFSLNACSFSQGTNTAQIGAL